MAAKKPKLKKVRVARKKASKKKVASLSPVEKKIVEHIEPIIERDIKPEIKEEVKEVMQVEEEDNMLRIALSIILSTIMTALIAAAIWWFNPMQLAQLTLISIVVWIFLTIIAYFFQSK